MYYRACVWNRCRCAYCPYTEPCRWSMRKHFRTRHAGIEVALTDLRDPEKDRRVEQLVEECAIPLKDVSENELLAVSWKQRSTSPKSNVVNRLTTFAAIRTSSSSVSKMTSSADTSPMSSARPVTSSGTSLRLHRCTQCSYTTSNLKLLRGHLVKHGPYRLQCAYCDYRGHYPSRIYKHIRRHHRGCAFRVVKVNEVNDDFVPLPPPVPAAVVEPDALKLHKRARPLPGNPSTDHCC